MGSARIGLVAFDFLDQLVVFLGQLVDFQPDQALQLHDEDGIGLGGGKSHAAVLLGFIIDAFLERLGNRRLPGERLIDGELLLHQVELGGGHVGARLCDCATAR